MANRKVSIKTSKGEIIATLNFDLAPITAGNFADLVERGFYDGLTFHRYEPNFVIQGGDPKGDGTGGFVDPETKRERRIQLEVTPSLKHDRAGVLAMARSQDKNSASCQFYITLKDASFLDMQYAVFGNVESGLENVLNLRRGDKIESITFVEGA